MNVQIYALKRNFDVQKAERYFKERKLPFQFVDLTRHKLGIREIETFKSQVGLKALIDETTNAWKESTARFLSPDGDALIEALAQNPKYLKLPIVRNGKQITVGYQPDIWAKWE